MVGEVCWVYVVKTWMKYLERVGEDKLGPGKDAQLVAHGVEVVAASKLVRGLIDASSPNSQLVTARGSVSDTMDSTQINHH